MKLSGLPERAWLLPLIAFTLYGRHLGDGLLSDDFLYALWLDDGPGQLLRKVTVDSDPRMIRPLPMAGFLLGASFGTALQHGLSILLHGLNAVLVSLLAERRGPGVGILAGLLFVTFPLFVEPVVWLSAAFDLWATFFALLALWLAGRGTALPALLCFAAGLLCKESILLLPLVLALPGGRRAWRPALVLGAGAGIYLGARWALFSGPGGYLDASGRSLAWKLDPALFLRNIGLEVPYRALTAIKQGAGADPWAWTLAAAAAGTALLLVHAARPWRRARAVAVALTAYAVAFAPAAPVFGLSPDHEGSRMLYFPIAVFCVAAAGALEPRRRLRPLGWTLALLWSLAVLYNGASYEAASREMRLTLAGLEAAQDRLQAGDTVWIHSHDTLGGAFVFRNAVYAAARYQGLRPDVEWRLAPPLDGPGSGDSGGPTYRATPDLDRLIWRPPLPEP